MIKKIECDGDCNHCSVMRGNKRNVIYTMLQDWVEKGCITVKMVNDRCPNLTVCPECHVDDFVHVEGCENDFKEH